VPGCASCFSRAYRGPGLCDRVRWARTSVPETPPRRNCPSVDGKLLSWAARICCDARIWNEGCLLQCRGNDIRCQGKVAPRADSSDNRLGLKSLQLAGQSPEQIEQVGYIHRGIEKIKGTDIWDDPKEARYLLPRCEKLPSTTEIANQTGHASSPAQAGGRIRSLQRRAVLEPRVISVLIASERKSVHTVRGCLRLDESLCRAPVPGADTVSEGRASGM